MDATQLHTRGDIVLAESRASGEIRLLGAHIAGELNCHDATLTNDAGPALNADGLRVDQGMFCDGSFRASGEIRLLGGHIAGQLSLSGATLTNDSGPALNADRLRVDQGVFCDGSFRASGEIRLVRAHIAGQISFRDATLTNDSATTRTGRCSGPRSSRRRGARPAL